MCMEYAPHGLIGLLTPQANTTVEPEAWALLAPGYSLINGRLVSQANGLNERLLDCFAQLEKSLVQFANAPLSVLALACTGSSYLMGQAQEARWVNDWQTRLQIPVVTAGRAVAAALHKLGVRHLDLLSPYPAELTQASQAHWISHGFRIDQVQPVPIDEAGFHAIDSTSSASASGAALALGPSRANAVLMLGTEMPSLKTLLLPRPAQSPPWLSCMLALMWQSVQAISASPSGTVPELRDWLQGRHWAQRARAMSLVPNTT